MIARVQVGPLGASDPGTGGIQLPIARAASRPAPAVDEFGYRCVHCDGAGAVPLHVIDSGTRRLKRLKTRLTVIMETVAQLRAGSSHLRMKGPGNAES